MKTTATDYMMELINYGGTMIPRGVAYQKLLNIASAQGHGSRAARQLADRWMQGFDLRQEQAWTCKAAGGKQCTPDQR